MTDVTEPHKLLIDGEWLDTAERFTVRDRFSGDPIAEVCAASEAHAAHAVERARVALDAGPPPPHARAEILYRAASLLESYRDRLVALMVAEAGFTLVDAGTEVSRAKLTLELSAETAKTICGHVCAVRRPSGLGGAHRLHFARSHRRRVCDHPFNSPLNTVLHKIGPSFAAGNPTVLKPSSLTPLTAGLLGQLLLEAGLPKGFLHVVHGESAVGEALLRNPDIAFYNLHWQHPGGEDHSGACRPAPYSDGTRLHRLDHRLCRR